jgi:peptidoglycan/LPS O-acetylase OafA/YrhL
LAARRAFGIGMATHRNNKLDALRGIAALIVVAHHVLHLCAPELVEVALRQPLRETATADWPGRLLASAVNGGIAVNIFFVLSGAVLMDSLRREGRIDASAAFRFTGRRIFRIFPALVLVIVVYALLSHLHVPAGVGWPFSLKEVVGNASLMNNGVIGVTWTLQTEMLMVPILLAIAWLRSIFGTIVLVAFVSWAQFCFYYGPPFGGYLLNVALTAFALGALIPTDMVAEACRKMPAKSLWFLMAGLVAARFYWSIDSGPALLATIVISTIIVALLYHDARADHPFERQDFRLLGRVSYSVYLVHVIVVYWPFSFYADFVGADRIAAHPFLFAALYCVYAIPVTVALSIASERHVERPFIHLGARLFPTAGRMARAAPQPQPAQ